MEVTVKGLATGVRSRELGAWAFVTWGVGHSQNIVGVLLESLVRFVAMDTHRPAARFVARYTFRVMVRAVGSSSCVRVVALVAVVRVATATMHVAAGGR